MSQETLSRMTAQIREQVATFCESSQVPGYLAGVYQNGEEIVIAHGLANVASEAPMHADTGFLFGSVTKLLTTTLVMQQVERGVLDLDERVVSYLPEFRLKTPGAPKRFAFAISYRTPTASTRISSSRMRRAAARCGRTLRASGGIAAHCSNPESM